MTAIVLPRVQTVAVVRTGVANLASVTAGLRRAGATPVVTGAAADVIAASHVVLPGVGAFGAAALALADGLGDAIRERIAADRPTLAICLGMQLLCNGSEESPRLSGLRLLGTRARRFPDTVMVPQMGWSRITADPACRLLQSGYAYFANSYYVPECPAGWHPAMAEHGCAYVAALERGSVLACQFHPELSGPWGLALLQRWLAPEAA